MMTWFTDLRDYLHISVWMSINDAMSQSLSVWEWITERSDSVGWGCLMKIQSLSTHQHANEKSKNKIVTQQSSGAVFSETTEEDGNRILNTF